MPVETFYRMFGVFDDGGTQTDGLMLDEDQIPGRVEEWLRKNKNLRTIQIVKVTKSYITISEELMRKEK